MSTNLDLDERGKVGGNLYTISQDPPLRHEVKETGIFANVIASIKK